MKDNCNLTEQKPTKTIIDEIHEKSNKRYKIINNIRDLVASDMLRCSATINNLTHYGIENDVTKLISNRLKKYKEMLKILNQDQ